MKITYEITDTFEALAGHDPLARSLAIAFREATPAFDAVPELLDQDAEVFVTFATSDDAAGICDDDAIGVHVRARKVIDSDNEVPEFDLNSRHQVMIFVDNLLGALRDDFDRLGSIDEPIVRSALSTAGHELAHIRQWLIAADHQTPAAATERHEDWQEELSRLQALICSQAIDRGASGAEPDEDEAEMIGAKFADHIPRHILAWLRESFNAALSPAVDMFH